MTQRPVQPKLECEPRLADETTFLRRFLGNPKRTGAVAPSSPYLAREMARAVDPDGAGLVVELGPGTGPVTKALIARGITRDRLVLVEYDRHFCGLLAERFPLTRVLQGDAYDLPGTLSGRLTEPVAAVVSSLPLLNETPQRRLKLLHDAFELMGPDGVFVQFTYGLKSPMPREALAGDYVARCGAPILRNLPPASVWTYRQRGSATAPKPRIMQWVDHAELFGRQFAAKRKAAGSMLSRHRDRMQDMLARETAGAFGRPGRGAERKP